MKEQLEKLYELSLSKDQSERILGIVLLERFDVVPLEWGKLEMYKHYSYFELLIRKVNGRQVRTLQKGKVFWCGQRENISFEAMRGTQYILLYAEEREGTT